MGRKRSTHTSGESDSPPRKIVKSSEDDPGEDTSSILERSADDVGGPNSSTLNAASDRRDEPICETPSGEKNGEDEEEDLAEHNKACLHEVCIPESFDTSQDPLIFNPPEPAKYEKNYPFKLDPFQVSAIACLERNESVLVSAHTSAGKTVVAEYAIALAFRDNTRVLYTSPIKALSNQKYRELYEVYKDDVGLITGDVSIRPEASCIVMTTEILRSMLYRGSELLREVKWVIFDEVHYIRDKERGVVWEETMILLPSEIRFVFLSATIPNAKEFAGWIAKLHQQPCHVVFTEFRPTPLQHYVFPSGGKGVFLVVDERGRFKEGNFQKAMAVLGSSAVEKERGEGRRPRKRKSGSNPSDVYNIVRMIVDRNYEPAIVFSFSKRECEALALHLSKLDFCSDEEKESVAMIFENALDLLSDEDKKLPAVGAILPLLKRGIGIHHGGLLPILKETIELLFQEGLLKVLFATETFAMGLNMPARTVVFTGVRKFDGKNFRPLTSGEYIQMSGRAGRRGIDTRGIVILMFDEKVENPKEMLKGAPDILRSAFHLSYNMLLNLMLVEGIESEHMLMRSFHQFQNDAQIPELKGRVAELQKERDNIQIINELEVADVFKIRKQLEKSRDEIRKVINRPVYLLPFLQIGRVISIRERGVDWGWGVLINKSQITQPQGSTIQYSMDVALFCQKESSGPDGGDEVALRPSSGEGSLRIVPVMTDLCDRISAVRLVVPKDLRSEQSLKSLGLSLQQLMKKFPDGLPLVDPIEDMLIRNQAFLDLLLRAERLEKRLESFSNISEADGFGEKFDLFQRKASLDDEIKGLSKQFRESQSMILKEELRCMMRVLRRLGFISEENIIQTKGRVACEVDTVDELLITELIFNGVFNDLSIAQTVALLSAMIFQESAEKKPKLALELEGPLNIMRETARRIAHVSQECKIPINEESYVNSFRPELMDVVYAWCNGASFVDICKMTDVFEGSIVRALHRLEELLRELQAAAKAIGNVELENKFAEGITKIKRDIAFAPSLYL